MATRRPDGYGAAANPHGGPSNYQAPFNGNSRNSQSSFRFEFLDTIHSYANIADNKLSELGAPVKPYLPLIGRFLVVATFLEDTWRIVTNWGEQTNYLWKVRGIPWFITQLFFITNVVLMVLGSICVLTKQRLFFGVCSFIGVLVSQAIFYGIWDLNFLARSLSLIGGLLLVVSDVFAQEKRRLPGLPEIDPKDRSQKFILVGRSLIVVLFISHLMRTSWSLGSILINLLSISSCVLLVVGYKARFSASILAMLLLTQNFAFNSYWTLQSWNPNRDSVRFEHFQVLSIIGGLIFLVNIGAGKLSFDEKRKIY